MGRIPGGRHVALVWLLAGIASLFGCGAAASSSGGPPPPQNLTIGNASLDFGTLVAGASSTLTDTVTNSSSSSASVTITSASASNASFKVVSPALPVTLTPGQSTAVTIAFSPQAAGKPSGTITLSSGAGQVQIAVSGTAVSTGALAVNPASLSFGNVMVGKSQTQSTSLTNAGGSPVTVSQASASNASFSISGLTLPLTLAPGQIANFSVVFTPTTTGSVSGSISVTGTASLSLSKSQTGNGRSVDVSTSVTMSGDGQSSGQLVLSPASVAFGSIQVGKSQSQTATLTNSGGSSITVSQATATGSGFSISGLTLPLTLPAGQSARFQAVFSPQQAGDVTGTISVASNASNPTVTASLSGTGLAAGALGASPSNLSFGSVLVGNNLSLAVTLTNSGSSTVTVSQATTSGAGYTLSGLTLPANLAAGQSVSFSVIFAPRASGTVTGSVVLTSNASNPNLTLPLTGTGSTPGALTTNPASLSFGSVQVGNSRILTESITNSGGSAVNLTQATVAGAGFAISGLTIPTQLSAGQSVTFSVSFAPLTPGAASGTLTVASNASNPSLGIGLGGTGTASGQLSGSPSSLSFGSVTVGSTKNLTSTLTATGASVTISTATSNSAEFSLSGLSFPATLTAGQSATITITFAPQASGSASGTVTFTSNAANPPTTLAGTGTGVAAVQHSASLSWQASTTTVAGYHVYRGTQSGGPYGLLNSSVVSALDYTDSTVQAGQTYYYVVTSVDSQGVESVQSNEAKAVVPSP